MNFPEKDPVKRMTRLFLVFLEDLWKIVAEMETNGISPDQFQQQGAAVFQKYHHILIGATVAPASTESSSAGQGKLTKEPNPHLAKALSDALPKNYLGDVTVVERLLRGLAFFTLENWRDISKGQKKVISKARRLGRLFLGADKKYVGIPGWNTPGGIDIFLYSKFPFDNSTPEASVACAVNEFLEETTDLMAMEQLGKSDAELSARLQGLIRRYTGFFLGMETSPDAKLQDAFPSEPGDDEIAEEEDDT